MTGRSLDAFETLPGPLVDHLGRELKIPTPDLASLRTLYVRHRTLFEHQRWAAEVVGFKPLNDRRRRVLLTQLRKEATETLSVNRLVQSARRWLYDTGILIPKERTLIDMARRAQSDCLVATLKHVEGSIPEVVRRQWLTTLLSEHPPYATVLAWLQLPPKRRSRKTAVEVLTKVEFLKELQVHEYPLTGISLERQRAYARRVRRRRPSKWADIKEPQRTIEMVCFLRITLMQLTDVFLSLEAGLSALAEAVTDEEVLLDHRGLHLQALEQEDRPEEVERVRRKLSDDVGSVQLPNLIVEMDSHVRFSWELLGRRGVRKLIAAPRPPGDAANASHTQGRRRPLSYC